MKKQLFVVILIALFLLSLFPFEIQADASEDLQNALTWAKAYLDRSYAELNSTHAAMRDLLGLPFTLHNVAEDKWLCPAKKTRDGFYLHLFNLGSILYYLSSSFFFGGLNIVETGLKMRFCAFDDLIEGFIIYWKF